MRLLTRAGIFLPIVAALLGQPAAFEVASLKPASPNARGATFQFTPGGGLTVQNGTLKGIIEMAYDVPDFQISGGRGWLDSDRYDIFAKSATSDAGPVRMTAEAVKETRRRLQTLLQERFHLQVHRETKQLPVFELVAAKKGAKLKESPPPDGVTRGAGIRGACGQMAGTRCTMEILANRLTRQLGRPVLNQTGLAGTYDFLLEWTPDAGPCPGASDSARPIIRRFSGLCKSNSG